MRFRRAATSIRPDASWLRRVLWVGLILSCGTAQGWAQGTVGITAKPGALERASKIQLPKVKFDDATFAEVVEYLRIKSRDHDPEKKGVNFIVKSSEASKAARITIQLNDIPLSEALREVTALAGVTLRFDEHAVVINHGVTRPESAAAILATESIAVKLAKSKVMPKVQFAGATVEEAASFLAVKASYSDSNPTPVAIRVHARVKPMNTQITLDLRDIPLLDAFAYVAELGEANLTEKDGKLVFELK